MNGDAIRALVAGLGASVATVGADLTRKKQHDQEETDRAAQAKRALDQLLAVEHAKAADAPIYGPAQPFETPTGPIMARENKRTGQYEPVSIGGDPPPVAQSGGVVPPPPPVTPTIHPAIASLVGQTIPDVTPPRVGSIPDLGLPTGAPRTGSIPKVPDVPQTTVPTTATIRPTVTPYVKPVAARPHLVKDEAGNYVPVNDQGVGPDGKPVKGFVPPRPAETLVQVDVPDGKGGVRTVWKKQSEAAGMTAHTTQPGTGGGGFGNGGIVGAGRAMAAINGMRAAHGDMKAFEQQVHDHQVSVDGLDYFKTQMGKMYNTTGVVDPAIHAAALANLNATNPALGNYLQQAEFWALEESNLSNRPSDFRTKLDEFVSALKPNMDEKQIESLWRSRETRLAGWDATAPAIQAMLDRAAAGGGTKPTGTTTTATKKPAPPAVAPVPPSADPAFDALMKKYPPKKPPT